VSTLITAVWRQTPQDTDNERTPFWRMLPSDIGGPV
jgi:hypothetical protein